MDLNSLEELAKAVSDLHKRAVTLNRQTESYRFEMSKFVLESETELNWIKGKIAELIDERRPTAPPPSTGREL